MNNVREKNEQSKQKQDETKQDGRQRAVSLGLGRVKTAIKGGGSEAT